MFTQIFTQIFTHSKIGSETLSKIGNEIGSTNHLWGNVSGAGGAGWTRGIRGGSVNAVDSMGSLYCGLAFDGPRLPPKGKGRKCS